MQTGDSILSTLIGNNTTLLQDFYNGDELLFDNVLTEFSSNLSQMTFLTPPINSLFNFADGNNSLLQSAGSVLYFPENYQSFDYAVNGLNTMNEITKEIQ